MYHLTIQMTPLYILPGKQKMCLQENLVDCTDCGGLIEVIKIEFIKIEVIKIEVIKIDVIKEFNFTVS